MANIERNTEFLGDDRLKKSAGETVRGSRNNADTDRENKDGMVLSAEERRAMLRSRYVQEILPTPPEVPGFHLTWLSTTNQADPIFRRMQFGYTPVKVSDVPGFAQLRVQGGEFDGCVAVNEMILFKVPNEIYEDLMVINHHDKPAENEQAIYERLQGAQQLDSRGKPVMTVEGDFERLRQASRAPSFV